MAAFETPEEAAARKQREAQQQMTAGYTPTGAPAPYDPTKNKQIIGGEWEGAGRKEQELINKGQAAVDAGNQLPGRFQGWGGNLKQDIVHANLSRGEADAQRKQNFGFGSGNNAETAAMIGDAQGTANRYSTVFGDMAGTAGDRSAAAQGRGTAGFQGDTSGYQTGMANAQQSRGMQTGAYGQLMNFANQGPGPSAAQAQLRSATDANTQNALAMARSGRGMGGGQAAMRQAIGQNAATQQGAANAAAELRANENTAFQSQRLDAMNKAGAIAGQAVAGDQGFAKTGLEGAQYQTDTTLKGTELNDRTAQGWADQQRAGVAGAHAAELAGQTQTMNVNAQALAGRQAEEDAAYRQAALERGDIAAAQANRQATTNALIGAGATTAAALSDERAKFNIKPVGSLSDEPETVTPGAPQGLNGVAPISIKPMDAPLPSDPGPNKRERKAAAGSAIGSTAGKIGGAAIGGLAGGPIGAIAGGAIGGLAGKYAGNELGKLFSDVRAKSNVEPLSKRKAAAGAYGDLERLADKYGAAGVATDPKSVARYADAAPKELARSHPILSKGDALLADSARSAPPSAYDYKDPSAPGAKPGKQVGPMAQDLAAHPVTRGMVDADPDTGLLRVDGARAATVGLAQNHSQQNQLDSLSSDLARLEGMLKRKKGDSSATGFKRDQSAGGLI